MKRVFCIVLLSLILVSGYAQKANLTINLVKGTEYRQFSTSGSTIYQDIMGQPFTMTMILKGGTVFKVVGIDSAGYDLEARFESLGMSMELPQGKVEYSSDKTGEEDIFSDLLSKMTTSIFNVRMLKNGKIPEVHYGDALIESVFEDYTDIPEDQLEQLKAQLKKAYGDEAIRGNLEMTTAIFPDHPVKKGDKWTITTNLESGMAALMTTEYEFTAKGKDYVIIKGNSVIKTADKDAYVESNGMTLKYDLEGSMISEIKVDKKTGWIVEAVITQKIDGTAFIKENPQLPEGLSVPMTMSSEIIITDTKQD